MKKNYNNQSDQGDCVKTIELARAASVNVLNRRLEQAASICKQTKSKKLHSLSAKMELTKATILFTLEHLYFPVDRELAKSACELLNSFHNSPTQNRLREIENTRKPVFVIEPESQSKSNKTNT